MLELELEARPYANLHAKVQVFCIFRFRDNCIAFVMAAVDPTSPRGDEQAAKFASNTSLHSQGSQDAREVSRLILSFQKDASQAQSHKRDTLSAPATPAMRSIIFALVWCVFFILSAVLSFIWAESLTIVYLAAWRWCCLFALLPIIFYVPQLMIFVAVVLLERISSDGQDQMVYLLMGVRKRCVWFLRVLFMQLSVHLVVSGGLGNPTWEGNLMRLWTCLSLVMAGTICSALIARSLSHHFHSKSYFSRMRSAIRKEQFLLTLSRSQSPAHSMYERSDVESGGPSILRRLSTLSHSTRVPSAPQPDHERNSLLKQDADPVVKSGWLGAWSSNLHRKWLTIHASTGKGKESSSQAELEKHLYWLEKHLRMHRPRFVTLTDQLQDAADRGKQESDEMIRKEAKELSFLLLRNILGAELSRPFIVARDLEPFFPTADEVKEAFLIFDPTSTGKASLDSMIETVYRILKERSKIALTLTDQKSIVTKLQFVCQFVIQFLLILVFLWIWEIDIVSLSLSISSICLAFAFIFGNSIRQMYESVLFLFIVHSFDVGDWIQLPNGDVIKVEEIALMNIVSQRLDGRRLYIPIQSLQESTVINLSRSENLWESFAFLVDFDSQCSKAVEILNAELKTFVGSRKSEFTGLSGVIARAYEGAQHKMKIVAYWEYTHVGEDSERTGNSRSDLLLALCRTLDQAGIIHTIPPEAPFRIPKDMHFSSDRIIPDSDDLGLFVSARSGGALFLSKKME